MSAAAPVPARWCGEDVLAVAGDGWRVLVSPSRGGKIVSLRHGAVEWLAQPRLPLPPPAVPGASFVQSEMCGWDECAPSIDACDVDGRAVPDHGDLWTQRWSVEGEWLLARGPSLDYGLARRVVADGPGVRIEYRAWTNAGPLPFLWAAHPQLVAPPGSLVEVVTTARRALDVLVDPPVPVPLDAVTCAIDSIPPGGCRKLYLEPTERATAVRVRRPDGESVTWTWDGQAAPYVGLWFDRGAFSREDVVAIEPSTGCYDSLARAQARGQVVTLVPGTELTWWCEVSFAGSQVVADS